MPLYYQLGEILKQRLEGGGWEPDTLFPSEREIEEYFGVSRAVVRPALSLLERDGDIYRRRGSGTYVSAPKRRVPIRGLIRSLREDSFSDSRIAVLRIRQQTNDQAIADFLDVSQGQTVAQVTSILRIDKPICLIDSFFPVSSGALAAGRRDFASGRRTAGPGRVAEAGPDRCFVRELILRALDRQKPRRPYWGSYLHRPALPVRFFRGPKRRTARRADPHPRSQRHFTASLRGCHCAQAGSVNAHA